MGQVSSTHDSITTKAVRLILCTGTAMNFNDLNYPVPASAYSCAGRCATQYPPVKECSTIWSDFNPVLALPPQIRTMDPAWASCSFWNGALPNFVFDPPVVLTSQAVFAVPTFTTTASSQATQSSVVTPGASVSVAQPTSSGRRQSGSSMLEGGGTTGSSRGDEPSAIASSSASQASSTVNGSARTYPEKARDPLCLLLFGLFYLMMNV